MSGQAALGGIQALIRQQLESLRRSGVTDLVRCTAAPVRPQAVEAPPEPTAARAKSATPAAAPAKQSVQAVPAVPTRPARHTPQPDATPRTKPGPSTLKDRQAALGALQQEVAACRRCEHLACARTQTVFGVGNLQPRLCFFGEAPGADEDRLGEPFVGRAGQLLTDIIHKGMGLQRSDVYILNVLKCRPPENRTPTDQEIADCREYFERQFEALKPEFICCLGATAAKALLNTKQPLGRLRGQWFNYHGARVIVTYHPSYLLRNPAAKKDTWEDIQLLMREMGLPTPPKS